MTLDQWAAKQCGIKIFAHPNDSHPKPLYYSSGVWALSDARCREIVREHFSIQTLIWNNLWFCAWDNGTQETNLFAKIAEAEIACIKAIREAQENE